MVAIGTGGELFHKKGSGPVPRLRRRNICYRFDAAIFAGSGSSSGSLNWTGTTVVSHPVPVRPRQSQPTGLGGGAPGPDPDPPGLTQVIQAFQNQAHVAAPVGNDDHRVLALTEQTETTVRHSGPG